MARITTTLCRARKCELEPPCESRCWVSNPGLSVDRNLSAPILHPARTVSTMGTISNIGDDVVRMIAFRSPCLFVVCHHFYFSVFCNTDNKSELVKCALYGPCLKDDEISLHLVRSIFVMRALPEFSTVSALVSDEYTKVGLGYFKGWTFDRYLWPRYLEMSAPALEKLFPRFLGTTQGGITAIEFFWSHHSDPAFRILVDTYEISIGARAGLVYDRNGRFTGRLVITEGLLAGMLHDLLFRHDKVACTILAEDDSGDTFPRKFECNGYFRKIKVLRAFTSKVDTQCIAEFSWSPMAK